MKKIILLFILIFLVLSSHIVSSQPYKIGYIEGGEYFLYEKTWDSFLDKIEKKGWLDKIEIHYYFSPGWGNTKLLDKQSKILMQDENLDLIVAMGTPANRYILKNNNGSTPIMGAGMSDPYSSGFIETETNTGIDNYTVRHFPKRWTKMIKTYYHLIKFKRVGIVYPNTKEGRSYSNITQWREVQNEFQSFEIVEEHISEEETCKETKEAIEKLIFERNIDSFYIPPLLPFDTDGECNSCIKLLKLLAENGITTFARDGEGLVKRGALYGLSGNDWDEVGKFHEKQAREILIEEVEPIDVNIVYGNRFSLLINTRVVEITGFHPNPLYSNLYEEVFTSVPWEE